ncbi:MAG: adenylosuccinate synthase [Dehalococcoidia bacterium]|nr:adenylosuccinate synthase [Dehalococcoidia bacterium]
MPVVAVIGAQWGDEGKGKIVDLLAAKADMTVRFSGGNNAGHTINNEMGEFKLHLVPSGIFHTNSVCIIGNGVAINPEVLLDEMDSIKYRGVDISHLYISDRAHLIMPYHLQLDALEEEARGQSAIGTTKMGIGPAFADKVGRLGIRMGDLLDKSQLWERLQFAVAQKNRLLTKVYEAPPVSDEQLFQTCLQYGERLRHHITETSIMVHEAIEQGKAVLMEGAQGTLLDLDFGTYPYVTSSSPTAGSVCLGVGVGPTMIDQVIGVFKAYSTRIGGGPMPTELADDMGLYLRERGQEYGTTTGRARRCGWFDAVVGKFSTRLNGFTSAAITRLDILDDLPEIKVCVGYRNEGSIYDYPPSNISLLAKCEPIYEEMSGWQAPTSDIRRLQDLPKNARAYVERLSELVGCPVSIVSVGADRQQTIMVKEAF